MCVKPPLTGYLIIMHQFVLTVIVIDPPTQTDNYMVSAHTEADGMLNINNNGMLLMLY